MLFHAHSHNYFHTHRPEVYSITVPPAIEPITVDEFKNFAGIPLTDTGKDTVIALLISSARGCAESFTKRTFINTTFQVLFEDFLHEFELRRSKFQSLNSFTFKLLGIDTAVDSADFEIEQREDFSVIRLAHGATWPTPDIVTQAVKMVFVAGYGAVATDVPAELRLALLNHVNAFFADNGDCDFDGAGSENSIPIHAKSIYQKFRIIDLGHN